MNNIIAVLTGVLISIMVFLNGGLSGNTGTYLSTLIIHIAGFITVIIILAIKRYKIKLVKGTPLYMYSAGIIGFFTVLCNNLTFKPLGVAITLALGLFGQAISSIIIDNFGFFGVPVDKFNKKKILGIAVMIIGIIVMTVVR